MDRFRILRGLPPKPIKWDDCPNCVIEDDFTAIIIPSHKATKETADILYSRVPKPYAVFVSDELELPELTYLAEKTEGNGTFQMAMQTLQVYNDRIWSSEEMDKLQSLKLNYLKNFAGIGFQIWSDHILGSQWGVPENPIPIHQLSTHRILKFIDKGKNLAAKFHRATNCMHQRLIPELVGDPLTGFSIRIPHTMTSLMFENDDSLFLGNRRG